MLSRKVVLLLACFLMLTLSLTLASCTGGNNNAETTAEVGGDNTEAPADDTADVTVGEGADVTEDVTADATAPESEPSDTTSDNGGETTADSSTDTQPDDGVTCVVNAVYPVPKKINVKAGESVSAIDISKITCDENAAKFADVLLATGVEAAEDGVPVTLTYPDLSGRTQSEAYTIKVTSDGVEVFAVNERAAFYAFNTLSQLVNDKLLPVTEITDAPAVPLRGVIEGFYGTAWSHQFRMELMDFMGDVKMNCYIYAPKDDAKHRAQWRALYTDAELNVLSELIGAAQDNYVRFVYAISPGGDIKLDAGYEEDLNKLFDKLEQMYELGVRDYAVFLDDIPTLDAEGHAKLLNDVQTKFVETHDGVSDLIAITTEYTDWMLTEYTDAIAPLLHEDLKLMWTGPGVSPETITEKSLAQINKKYGREVFIWWNYPVNDVVVNNLYMDACRGLETTLYSSISGLVANPMNQGNASYVPLFTTADYLWNPTDYDPNTSLAHATEVIDPDIREALLHFIDMTCASPMNGNKTTVEFKKTFDKYVFGEYDAELVETILAEFSRMVEYADIIKTAENTAFVDEITPWLNKYRAFGEMGIAYFNIVKAKAEGADEAQLLAYAQDYYNASRSISQNLKSVSYDVLGLFFDSCELKINRLLGIGAYKGGVVATPMTNCRQYEDYDLAYIADGDPSTYFWTKGALHEMPDGVGYIGLDLGEIIKVNSIYILTGVSGSDIFNKGVIEYSTDNEKWITLVEGSFGEEISYTGLDFEARYVRLRNSDSSATTWVKCRSFEVNSSRGASTTVNTIPSTSIATYQQYFPDYMADGDYSTFYWAGRGLNVGDYIMIDLGIATKVQQIDIRMGVAGHTDDYIRNSELLYSADGSKWESLGKFTSRTILMEDISIMARYIKLVATEAQGNWLTVSEFSAYNLDGVSDKIVVDDSLANMSDVIKLTDSNLFTSFEVSANTADGKSIIITKDAGETVEIYSMMFDPSTKIVCKDADGKVIGESELEAYTAISDSKVATVEITFGNKAVLISEITWSVG